MNPGKGSKRPAVFVEQTVAGSSSDPFRCRSAALFVLFAFLLRAGFCAAHAATLSDPEVDQYNMRVGTQTFSGLYKFTTNTLLVETAEAIRDMGSDAIKMKLGSGFFSSYGITKPSSITNLVTLARNEPSCRRVLDMPFRHIIAWTYAFSTTTPNWNTGYTSSTVSSNDYREFYDLTRYLLTNYDNSGKTFYLGHWEGDGYLCPNSNWSTNPTPTMVQGFINYLNNRQKAIDDAKQATAFTNVNVFGYAECNRVRDAINGNTNSNIRMINAVIPYVTNLDYVSYSSYDMQRLSDATKQSTMDYVEAHVPTNKASVIPGERVWIGEYGYANAGDSPAQQEPEARAYIKWLLNYGRKGIPFILFWEIYDNETNADGSYKYFYLIDPSGNKAPCYYLHQRFLNTGRMLVAQFKESNQRVPTDAEFVSMISPFLNQPFPAPTNLDVANLGAVLSSNSTVNVSGSFAQGVYGDECATVSVYFGRQDGGTVRSAWERNQVIGVNTNFNAATFTATLTNLVPQTNYFFRFYATNASGEAWPSSSVQFGTESVNPSDYGSRMKITFSGYNRGEPLDDFPVLVNLSTNLPGFSYRQFASPTGGDLRFTDAGGLQLLPFEIDEWNTNGTSRVWVRVPQLATTSDAIWVYWGNPAAASLPATCTNGAVWSADHLLVWHLKESALPYADSAQRSPAISGVAPASTGAQIGLGGAFNGSSQYLNAQSLNVGSAFTICAWVKLDATATNIQTIWANKSSGWNSDGFALYVNSYNTTDQQLRLETGNGTTGLTASTASGAVSFGQWHLLTAAVDRTAGTARLYVDGADRTQSGSAVTSFKTQSAVNLARMTNSTYYFKGTLDEVRIESGARSSNWVWASWQTATSNSSLASCSAVTQQMPTAALAADEAGMHLSWPGYGVGFSLYGTTNLSSPIWIRETNRPVWLDNQWQVFLPADAAPRKFYRLQGQ